MRKKAKRKPDKLGQNTNTFIALSLNSTSDFVVSKEIIIASQQCEIWQTNSTHDHMIPMKAFNNIES